MKLNLLSPRWIIPCAVLATAAAIGSGCSPTKSELQLAEPPFFGVDPEGWPIRHKVADPDAGVTMLRSEMPEAERMRREKEYTASSLVPVPLESKFNAPLFRLDGVKEYDGHVAIAPKIFAYGSRSKGKIVPKHNGDGTVTLTFSVIFTDGLSEKITAPDDESQVTLPETLRVRHEGELVAQLQSRFGAGVKVSPLPGCAKEIYGWVPERGRSESRLRATQVPTQRSDGILLCCVGSPHDECQRQSLHDIRKAETPPRPRI